MIKVFLGELQLPVNPFEEIKINVPGKNKTYEIVNLGEVNRIRDRGLINLTIHSLFPKEKYPFVTIENLLPPETYLEYIKEIIDNKQQVRFIVTGSRIINDANFLVSIESFEYQEHYGETGEYYYKLELKEYREHVAKRVVIVSQTNQQAAAAPQVAYAEVKERPSTREVPKEHVVVSGDTLWKIAKTHLQKGERYPEIAQLNNIKAPYTIFPGQRLKLPQSSGQGRQGQGMMA